MVPEEVRERAMALARETPIGYDEAERLCLAEADGRLVRMAVACAVRGLVPDNLLRRMQGEAPASVRALWAIRVACRPQPLRNLNP